jgi:hypothetical protein
MLRISHKGGEKVSKGNYWNYSNGERVSIDSEGTLPGDGSVTYYKANPVIILAAGPILGLLYAAFLPFIGIAIVMKLVITKLFGRSMDEVSRVATFNWRPTEAYLAGKRHKDKKGEARTPEDDSASEIKKD